MTAFEFNNVASILVEDEICSRLGPALKNRFACKRPFLVTDQGLVKAGLLEPFLQSLVGTGLTPAVFDGVEADPSEAVIEKAVVEARLHGADLIVGFGGGSSLDVAKLVSVLIGGEQRLSDMYGIDQIRVDRLPLVQIPTTAGTGSEVTPIAVVTTGATRKMGVVDTTLYADLAVLDATLTLGLPRHVTAATGIDAMVHAIEAFTSKHKKNPISDGLACAALKLLSRSLVTACEAPGVLDARRDMLVGAMLAGQAFANAPVAAVHGLAYPLGGHFHIPHGLSNALVLPHVLRFNAAVAPEPYATLAREIGCGECAEDLVLWLEKIAEDVGIERRLRDVGISHNDLPMLAEDAMLQERLLVNNPRDVSLSDALKIYEAAW